MDVPTYSRGRGLKINGAARGGHKNKQWIAGQGTVSSHGREASVHGSDGERWERGGGPRRGRGKGRGSARASPHLTLTVQHEEATSGTEDEGQDATDMEGDEEESVITEPEDKDLETPEERERFYQELVKAREVERKNAIADGKMDDPNVPKRLEDAITMVGTCMDMCPRFERYRRERENNLDRWEVIPGTKRVDHKRAVKIYERAAGDKTLPSDLRPPAVLKRTLKYLFHDLIKRGGFSDTYNFIRDRSRAVRNEFTIQHETGPLAIECHDRCARFHILAMHLERDSPGFSLAMEEQQLMYTLQSLKEFYEDQRGRYSASTELEMRVYHRLIHIRDQRERHEEIPEEITSHPVFQLTTKFRLHVQEKSAPITKTSRLVVDAEGMQIFAELAEHLRAQNNVVMIYLVACIIERLFGKGTVEGIEDIRGDLTIAEIIDGVSRPATKPSMLSSIPTVINGSRPESEKSVELASSGTSGPISALGAPASVSAVSTPPPKEPAQVQSAFGNLSARPNSFSNIASVFGGPTFGSAPSAFTAAPKSAFGPVASTSVPSIPQSAAPPAFMTPSSISFPFFDQSPTPILSSLEQPKLSFTSSTAPAVFPPPTITAENMMSVSEAGSLAPSLAPTSSVTPANSFGLNPNATAFTPSSSFGGSSSNFLPTTLSVSPETVPRLSISPTAPEPHASVPAFSLPATQPQPEATAPKRIVERRETLWEFPGLPSQQHASPLAGSVTPTTASLVNPPQLGRVQPMDLPPTPTARWFESVPFPKKGDTLSLRKQSLLSLQMPETPSHAEILSPLAFASPSVSKPTSPPEVNPMPKLFAPALGLNVPPKTPTPAQGASPASKTTLPPPPQGTTLSKKPPSPSPVASTSRIQSPLESQSTTSPSFKLKGKEKELILDRAAVNKFTEEFLRRSVVVKRCFRKWKKKTVERGLYEEAYQRSEAYKEKIRRERLPNSQRSAVPQHHINFDSRRELMVALPVTPKKRPPRVSSEYRPPLTDEALAQQLKENHKEHEKRWTRGSFLRTIRVRVIADAPDNTYPPQWRIWASTNSESDATAIWLEHKLDVPDSGEWLSNKVFSIPVVPKARNPPSPGSPGLIIFERTPLDGCVDSIEKKYRILDDCSRLRDIVETLRSQPKFRFVPALLIVAWSDENEIDVAPDFKDMVKVFVAEGVIGAAGNFTIASQDKDLDQKFEDALALLRLDLEDKSTVALSWQSLTEPFIAAFRTYASDWLDSCWINDRETLDWARYGEVVRSVEEVQTALVRELLGLLNIRYHDRVPISVDLHDHAHLGEGKPYATDLFLDSIVDTSIRRTEDILGYDLKKKIYLMPKDKLETSRQRLDNVLQNMAERLRLHAAAWLSTRSAQKRRASGDTTPGSPSSPKRLKASPTPSVQSIEEIEEVQSNGFHMSPPLSTAPSSIAVTEVPQKPQVTAAMLRALAQGILRGAT